LFYWADDDIRPFLVPASEKEKWKNSISDTGYFRVIAAPLASEITARLPPYLIHENQAFALTVLRKEVVGYCVRYEAVIGDKISLYLDGFGHAEEMADALAKLWKHLKAEKII